LSPGPPIDHATDRPRAGRLPDRAPAGLGLRPAGRRLRWGRRPDRRGCGRDPGARGRPQAAHPLARRLEQLGEESAGPHPDHPGGLPVTRGRVPRHVRRAPAPGRGARDPRPVHRREEPVRVTHAPAGPGPAPCRPRHCKHEGQAGGRKQ
jgi:hypothetical protein